jgi:hypothetical protein
MFAIYPCGIPCLYFYVLFKNRYRIMDMKEEMAESKKLTQGQLRSPGAAGTGTGTGIGANGGRVGTGISGAAGGGGMMPMTVTVPIMRSHSAAALIERQQSGVGVMRHITPDAIKFLHKAYEGKFWYWEVVETLRRLLLTAVVSIVATGAHELS